MQQHSEQPALSRSRLTIEPSCLLAVAAALIVVGLVAVGTAAASLDSPMLSTRLAKHTVGRQMIFALISAVMALVAVKASPRLLLRGGSGWRRPLLMAFAALVIISLFLVLAVGREENGSRRWLQVGPASLRLGFQPSEFAKLAMVLVLAWLFTRTNADSRDFVRGFLPAAGVIGLCVGLVGVEDFGTAALLAAVGGFMLLVGGCRWQHLAVMAATGATGMTALLFAAPYRLGRITAFLHPDLDPLGTGYHPMQSLMTISSGDWLGTGLGAGIAKYYLPERTTDFIFAVICEETGVVGGIGVICLFLLLMALGLRILKAAPTRFERLVVFGVMFAIGLQAVMNVAVVTVVAPTTGISLPLVSAGGSGLMVWCTALGLVYAIALRGRAAAAVAEDHCDDDDEWEEHWADDAAADLA